MAWFPLHLRRQLHLSTYMHRIINGNFPYPFMEKFTCFSGGSHDGKYCNLCTHKSKSQEEFFYFAAKAWNILPQTIRASESSKSFLPPIEMLLWKKSERMNITKPTILMLSSIYSTQQIHLTITD